MKAKIEKIEEKLTEWFGDKGITVQKFPLYDSAIELIAKVELQQYVEFCSAIEGECIFENEILENRYKLFQMEEVDVYAYYTVGDSRIRVICSKHMQYPFGTECQKSADDVNIAVLNMSYNEQPGGNNGLCIVLTLGDGRFVIYDSGFMKSDGDRLFQYLKESNVRADGITIAAWVLTHGHEDHYGAFVHFVKAYSDCVSVQYFMVNPVLNCKEREDDLIEVVEKIKENYSKSEILIPHSGMKFYFDNLELEVLFNHEDVRPQRILTINDASVVTRLRANGKTMLMMGDCQWCVPLVQRAMQGYVKSDLLQVPHHGDSGGTQEFYNLVDPETVIYTTSLEKFKQENSTDWYLAPNYYLLNKLHVKTVVVADSCVQRLVLPGNANNDVEIGEKEKGGESGGSDTRPYI